jgi:putative ATP-binding cassette transporter
MQLASAFVQVQIAIGWLVDHYRAIAEWFASARRITELTDSFDAVDESPLGSQFAIVRANSFDGYIHLDTLHLTDQTGRVVVDQVDLHIRKSEKIRIIGGSGSGKSVLVQAISGLWPWGKGSISIPDGSTMSFIAVAPFLPAGTLRETMTYPSLIDCTDQTLVDTLEYAGLSHLTSRLDETARWDVRLSASERQRLAIARVFLQRPDVIIMEDSLNALDNVDQTELLQKIADTKPETTIIFVGGINGPAFSFNRTFHLETSASGSRLLKSNAPFHTKEPM